MEFQSMIRRSRQEKLRALASRLAVEIAKAKGDPAYKKYKLYRDKFVDQKKMLGKKYLALAKRQARMAMMKSKQKQESQQNR